MHKTLMILMIGLLAAVLPAKTTVRWVGGTTAVAQVDHYTPANVGIGDTFTLTATGENGDIKAVSFTATAATVQNVVEGLMVAWNAETHYLCATVTATEDDTKVILTADTAGRPFYVDPSETDGDGLNNQTFTKLASVASMGPYDWNTAANWDRGVVPGAEIDQDVYVEGGTILYGLDQSTITNTLDELHVINTQLSANPSDGLNAAYLQIKATDIHIGDHWGPGSLVQATPVMIDTGMTASTITVYATGTNSTSTLPAVWLRTNYTSSKLIVYSGTVGVCYDKASTSTLGSIYNYGGRIYSGDGLIVATLEQTGGTSILHVGQTLSTCNVRGGTATIYGYGYGITTGNIHGGTITLYSPVTTLNVYDGTVILRTDSGDGSIGTLTVWDGTVYYKGSTGITTLDIYAGTVDCREGTASRTIGTCRMNPGAKFIYNTADITLTNKIQPKTTDQVLQVSYETP